MLVVGGGGREHALCLGLRRDPAVDDLVCAPGNPGIAQVAETAPLTTPGKVARAIRPDLVVIGPEAPLVAGAADELRDAGFLVFGPSAAAAQLEGSKAFAKEVMATAGVPTARHWVAQTPEETGAILSGLSPPYVVKHDGLAAGKGVLVTHDRDDALVHAAGRRVVIEEYLDGPELSLFCVTDGRSVVPLLPAQDFKRLGDGDTGPNTGGMGAYAPVDWAPPSLVDEVVERIARPTIDELHRRGMPFAGLLYIGLALTIEGPEVVEFNCRFGDPETQAVLSLLDSPLGQLLEAAAAGSLAKHPPLRWHTGSAVTVVVAGEGYPSAARIGQPLSGVIAAEQVKGVSVLHAGTAYDPGGRLVSSGGRVLAVTAVADTLADARDSAYEGLARIEMPSAYWRTDIAAAAVRGEVIVPERREGAR